MSTPRLTFITGEMQKNASSLLFVYELERKSQVPVSRYTISANGNVLRDVTVGRESYIMALLLYHFAKIVGSDEFEMTEELVDDLYDFVTRAINLGREECPDYEALMSNDGPVVVEIFRK